MSLDFTKISPWKDITDVTIDGQAMVKIPKFYVKYGLGPDGSTQASEPCWWVSDHAKTGFHVHPAFMKAGAEIDQFYVGKYLANNAGSSKAGSAAGTAPWTSITADAMTTYCANRNTGGVAGFHKMSVYEWAAIQLLALIELGTPNVQTKIGYGTSGANSGTTNAVWHGIYELWGDVLQNIDGIKGSGTTYQIWDNQGNQAYQTLPIAASGSGWIKDTYTDVEGTLYRTSDLFIPKTLDSTEGNGTFGDYQWGPASNFVVYVGGYDSDTHCGLFTWDLSGNASNTRSYYGFRLAKW